jgi:hypothetical protein
MGGISVSLENDLRSLEEAVGRPNPYEQYHLVDNPFPDHGEERSDVCTDQQGIKREFLTILQQFSPGAKRLRINGGTGAGKTNILRYFESLTREARARGLIDNIYPVYVYAPGNDYFAIHKQIVDRITRFFMDDLVSAVQQTPDILDALEDEAALPTDLARALRAVAAQRAIPFGSVENPRVDIFIRWIEGSRISRDDKSLFRGLSTVDSTSLAIRLLDGLFNVLDHLGLCNGIVLLFDEFEEIFETLTRTRHSQYARGLRHLLDTLQEFVFFVIATTPNPKDLGQYPAVERRLGEPLRLQPIDSGDLAVAYVLDYMEAGRKRYFQERGIEPESDNLDPLHPLTRERVVQEYRQLDEEAAQAGLEVLPGYFLPRMHQRMKDIVENGEAE